MKAAFFEATGGPEVLRHGDLPTPEPKAGEIRVKVGAASLNPIDTYVRAGLAAAGNPLPFVTGRDFAGTVDAIGSGVKRFQVGDRVWGCNQGAGGRTGSFAEWLVTGEDWAYPVPANVSDETAAAAALVGITAHVGLFSNARLKAGEWVFVNGGTGGVGAVVVQVAKAVGAKVITTVGSTEKAKLARELGADVVLNYKTDDIVKGVKDATGGKGVDVWYETQPPSDFDRTFDLMAFRGRIIVMAGRKARPEFPNGAFYVKGLSLHGFAMFTYPPAEQRVCAEDINRWLAEGKLKVIIGQTFPLSQAAEAHRLQEANTLNKAGTLSGKIVVKPGS